MRLHGIARVQRRPVQVRRERPLDERQHTFGHLPERRRACAGARPSRAPRVQAEVLVERDVRDRSGSLAANVRERGGGRGGVQPRGRRRDGRPPRQAGRPRPGVHARERVLRRQRSARKARRRLREDVRGAIQARRRGDVRQELRRHRRLGLRVRGSDAAVRVGDEEGHLGDDRAGGPPPERSVSRRRAGGVELLGDGAGHRARRGRHRLGERELVRRGGGGRAQARRLDRRALLPVRRVRGRGGDRVGFVLRRRQRDQPAGIPPAAVRVRRPSVREGRHDVRAPVPGALAAPMGAVEYFNTVRVRALGWRRHQVLGV